jgi:hypothetical protein
MSNAEVTSQDGLETALARSAFRDRKTKRSRAPDYFRIADYTDKYYASWI